MMDGSLVQDTSPGEPAAAGAPAPLPAPGRPGGGPTDGGDPRGGGLWGRVLRGLSGKDSLAVLDQAVVSGTSFLTTILIGRWCGADELGIYSLGFTLLVTWGCVQESLVALPYTIRRHRLLRETQAEYAGSVLVHQGLLSALALVTLAATGAAMSWGGVVPGL